MTDEQKEIYAGMFVLKLIDLKPEDGGMEMPVNLPHALQPFESVLDRLAVDSYVAVDRKKGKWVLTDEGIRYLGVLIDEVEGYIQEFDDWEASAMVRELRRRNLDPMRVRFMWGWYSGEFDDPVIYQQRRGISPVEEDWAAFITSDTFFTDLARDITDA
jgi:hypothetical protein